MRSEGHRIRRGEIFLSVSLKSRSLHMKGKFRDCDGWHEMRKLVKDLLDTEGEGWVAPGRDLEEIRSRNKMLLEHYISKMASGKLPEEVKKIWPFLE
jgi:hypothetical protein